MTELCACKYKGKTIGRVFSGSVFSWGRSLHMHVTAILALQGCCCCREIILFFSYFFFFYLPCVLRFFFFRFFPHFFPFVLSSCFLVYSFRFFYLERWPCSITPSSRSCRRTTASQVRRGGGLVQGAIEFLGPLSHTHTYEIVHKRLTETQVQQ